MDGFDGFEPDVGQIRGLRTFRIGPGGWLYPLFSDRSWVEGPNTARCLAIHWAVNGTVEHEPPEPSCSCGFYAYGSQAAADQYPHARHVQAVVSCWGRVIAGTRGLRAEYCRIEGLWLSSAVPEDLAALVAANYPNVALYGSAGQMLAQHPLTELACYEAPSAPSRGLSGRLLGMATAAAVCGILPVEWLGGARDAALIWGVLGGVFLCLAALLTWRQGADLNAGRRFLLCVSTALWMWAPLVGLPGPLVIRLCLLELAGLTLFRRILMVRSANRFPARIG